MKNIIISLFVLLSSLSIAQAHEKLSLPAGITLGSAICVDLAKRDFSSLAADCVLAQRNVLLEMTQGYPTTASKMITSICSQWSNVFISSLCLEIGIQNAFTPELLDACPPPARSRFGADKQMVRRDCLTNILRRFE